MTPNTEPSTFRDHFSGHASDYARYRPDYPEELFAYLAKLAPACRRAWDCGTGSGQAASALARHFDEVIATDASAPQIESASPQPRVDYRVAAAEQSEIEDHSVDLVTVAQALHWFDLDRFWGEVERVLVPGGVIAVWCYGLLSAGPDVDPLIGRLYHDVVGPCWPPERASVERGYRDLSFPFVEIEPPPFTMRKLWRLPELVGYFRTWSATRRYLVEKEEDPVAPIENELAELWGDPAVRRSIRWPLNLRVGRSPNLESGGRNPAGGR